MKSASKLALVACFLILTFTEFFFYPRWKKSGSEATIAWDVSGYYMYLPALFIYKDIRQLPFKDSILAKYGPTPNFQQGFLHKPSGNYVLKYSSGQAITMLPWFLVAHAWASHSTAYPADGFSYPYQLCIGVGMFLYALLGLYYLRRILLVYFPDSAVAISLLCVVVGTNYLNYAAIDTAMTHSVLFTIYTLIIWNTIRFYESMRRRNLVAAGLLCGLAVLIRPTEIVCLAIPLLWNLSRLGELRPRLQFLAAHLRELLLFAVCFGAVAFLQPLYWKYVSGQWIVYSYEDQGFSWLHPHYKDYLFSYWSGWIRFFPFMVLPFVGLPSLYRRRVSFWCLLPLIVVSLYIVTAWDVWDYGGTGGRAMIQYYPALLFPFTALVADVNRSKALRFAFYPVCLLLVYLGFWWVYHAHAGNIQASQVSREYYWKKIGRWSGTDEEKKLIDGPHLYEGTLQRPSVIYTNTFDSDTSPVAVTADGNRMLQVDKEHAYTTKYGLANPNDGRSWIRAFASFSDGQKEWDFWQQPQFTMEFYKGSERLQTNMLRVHRFLNDNETKELYVDAKLPRQWDSLFVFVWSAGSSKPLKIDNLKLVSFDPEK